MSTTRWLYFFIMLHVLAWTCIPWLVRFNLPMDAMEGTTWGQHLALGYDKNPFMNGWLTAFAVFCGGKSTWTIYLFSQLSVALCFWSVWKLGRKMLPPILAVVAVFLLEGVQYYNFHAIDFNDNTLELCLWGLTILFFYQALREQTLKNWLLTSLFASLGMLTKYYTAMLLLAMFILMLCEPAARKSFKNPSFYWALSVFFGLLSPHLIWLYQHDFITITYAFERTANQQHWLNHLNNPFQFAWRQLLIFLPALILAKLLRSSRQTQAIQATEFDKTFLYFVGFGPLLLTLLLSAITGMNLHASWGQPLLSLWVIILMVWLKPDITKKRFYSFARLLLIITSVILIIYSNALILAPAPSSANYPGIIIANTLTTEWQQRYHTQVKYIAGSRWPAGNIAFYTQHKPSVYINWNNKISPWINEKDLRQHGAIFVWDPNDEPPVAVEAIQKRFPRLEKPRLRHFAWRRNATLSPVELRIAFLPPTKSLN